MRQYLRIFLRWMFIAAVARFLPFASRLPVRLDPLAFHQALSGLQPYIHLAWVSSHQINESTLGKGRAMGPVNFICNIIWFVLAGVWLALGWALFGVLWCISIVGIPVGMQCFKVARLALMPFGSEVVNSGGAVSFLVNVLWFFIGGWELCLLGLVTGALCCITIVGIPAGMQSFKFAKLALMPFGSRVA